MLARRIRGSGCSFLPTLTVCGNYNRKGASETSGDGLATVIGGPMNPEWLEWFMGVPKGWTGREPLGKEWCHWQRHMRSQLFLEK